MTKPYHHGDLRTALLTAAEEIVNRDGVAGLTLRGVAREVGASHAAPKNHFDDLTGLLSELAAIGFTRFADRMQAAAAAQTAPADKLNAIGRAYVEFALAEPGLFQLMFRGERLDKSRPALDAAMERAFGTLTGSVAATHEGDPDVARATRAHAARAWSMVHGYAILLLDDRLNPLLDADAPHDDALTLLDDMLKG
ncbi:MAG: TetR/AcrR family transcriptional regulator [Sphingopyxis sp.]